MKRRVKTSGRKRALGVISTLIVLGFALAFSYPLFASTQSAENKGESKQLLAQNLKRGSAPDKGAVYDPCPCFSADKLRDSVGPYLNGKKINCDYSKQTVVSFNVEPEPGKLIEVVAGYENIPGLEGHFEPFRKSICIFQNTPTNEWTYNEMYDEGKSGKACLALIAKYCPKIPR